MAHGAVHWVVTGYSRSGPILYVNYMYCTAFQAALSTGWQSLQRSSWPRVLFSQIVGMIAFLAGGGGAGCTAGVQAYRGCPCTEQSLRAQSPGGVGALATLEAIVRLAMRPAMTMRPRPTWSSVRVRATSHACSSLDRISPLIFLPYRGGNVLMEIPRRPWRASCWSRRMRLDSPPTRESGPSSGCGS